jgi:hypothetical protein
MNKLWTILIGLALVSSAQAQTTDWKWNAEMRTRYTNDMTKTFVKGALGENTNAFNSRVKIGTTFMRGDSLTGHVSLLHNNMWGDKTAYSGAFATHDKVVQANVLTVNEAWGWWKSNDMLSMKFGRAGFEYGDGTIFAIDDWQAVPNSWDGIWTQWAFDFADLHLFGNKLSDGYTAVASQSDPEVVAYGLVANFKNLPEFLKHGFVHILQVNVDRGVTAATSNQNQMHAGLTLMGDANALDYRFTYDMVTGKTTLGATDTTDAMNMMDFELGYNMPEMMKLRAALMYHSDTGDSSSTDDKNETYQPVYYDSHKFAGLMDVVNWGNSTYYGLGVSVAPAEDLTAGLQYLMFSRSKDSAAASLNVATGAGSTTSKEVGSEADITVTKTYGDNFSIWGMYGMFMPGAYIKDLNGGTGDTASRLQLQAKLTF